VAINQPFPENTAGGLGLGLTMGGNGPDDGGGGGGPTNAILLEDGVNFIELEDGSGVILLDG
jgi:hypothetical protein